jgi:hypothetical protein
MAASSGPHQPAGAHAGQLATTDSFKDVRSAAFVDALPETISPPSFWSMASHRAGHLLSPPVQI